LRQLVMIRCRRPSDRIRVRRNAEIPPAPGRLQGLLGGCHLLPVRGGEPVSLNADGAGEDE
jgi:hypothetical protein